MKYDFDSDSDSDGSHISATPPRNRKPSSPPQNRHQSPPVRTLDFSSSRSDLKPKPKSKLKSRPKPKQTPSSESLNVIGADSKLSGDRSPILSDAAYFPFQIHRRTSDISRAVSSFGSSVDVLPAGFFSKSASFSRIRRTSLVFDASSEAVPKSEGVFQVNEPSAPNWSPEELNEEASSGYGNSTKSTKRHSNLIGGNVPLPPVKLKKCGAGEGNFVKLNMKRNKKFLNKRGQSSVSNRRRPYKSFKKKVKTVRKTDEENESVHEETGSFAEMMPQQKKEPRQKKQKKPEGKRPKVDPESIEQAISAARSEPSDGNLVDLLRLSHGYDSFREGQLEAIKMVLSGKSSMLVLPTGAGKSLCYQFPAMLLPGITLVVSPLVALMIDQLKQLPPVIKGGLICSSQTPAEAFETVQLLKEGAIKVLFVSPERFLNTEFLSMFSSTVFISLVVVDEAHCISEWSHNFRPSYTRLRASLLKEKLNVDSILAMTATATTTTLHAVMSALDIPLTNLIQKAQLRDNFQLSVSLSKNRMKDLLALIKSSPFMDVKSIIVYCKFQYETDIISRYLCDYGISAKSYHSGLFAKDRSRVQDMFCNNKVRVVVATVAFGMGLDKKDVGAVIHYSLPESLEEYVQEIGRAGRDGRSSYCHLFVDEETYYKLRSLMFSDGVDQYAVDKFLSQVFTKDKKSLGKISSVLKESVSRKFDIKEEVMNTLLTQLELGEEQFLHLLPQSNVTCSLTFHKTSADVLAERDMVVAEIMQKSEFKQGESLFDMPTVANGIGITTADLLNQLQILKAKGEINYELKDQAFCYTVVKVPEDLCSLSAHLTKWLSEVESCKVRKLDTMFNAAQFALNSCEKSNGCSGAQHTVCLQRRISEYFNESYDDFPNKMGQSSPFLRADIKVFLQRNSHAKFTPRAVARIMHGIASPAYPSATWSKAHFWGRYTHIDFHAVMEAAKAELVNITKKD